MLERLLVHVVVAEGLADAARLQALHVGDELAVEALDLAHDARVAQHHAQVEGEQDFERLVALHLLELHVVRLAKTRRALLLAATVASTTLLDALVAAQVERVQFARQVRVQRPVAEARATLTREKVLLEQTLLALVHLVDRVDEAVVVAHVLARSDASQGANLTLRAAEVARHVRIARVVEEREEGVEAGADGHRARLLHRLRLRVGQLQAAALVRIARYRLQVAQHEAADKARLLAGDASGIILVEEVATRRRRQLDEEHGDEGASKEVAGGARGRVGDQVEYGQVVVGVVLVDDVTHEAHRVLVAPVVGLVLGLVCEQSGAQRLEALQARLEHHTQRQPLHVSDRRAVEEQIQEATLDPMMRAPRSPCTLHAAVGDARALLTVRYVHLEQVERLHALEAVALGVVAEEDAGVGRLVHHYLAHVDWPRGLEEEALLERVVDGERAGCARDARVAFARRQLEAYLAVVLEQAFLLRAFVSFTPYEFNK